MCSEGRKFGNELGMNKEESVIDAEGEAAWRCGGARGKAEGGCHALAAVTPNIPLSRAPSLVEPDEPHTIQWPPPPSRSRSM